MRKECQLTYFIELGSDNGIITIFTDKPEKTEEIAQLITTMPTLKQQSDDLLATCKTAEKELEQRYKAHQGSPIDKLVLKIIKAAIAKCEA